MNVMDYDDLYAAAVAHVTDQVPGATAEHFEMVFSLIEKVSLPLHTPDASVAACAHGWIIGESMSLDPDYKAMAVASTLGFEWGLDARLGSILWPLKNDEVQK